MNAGERIPYAVVAGAMILGVIGFIGLWYLALFTLAALIFVIVWLFSRSQHKKSRELLQFRPGTMIPAEIWARAEDMMVADGPDEAKTTIVELDKYAENWKKFKDLAQVDRPGEVMVYAHLIAYKTPTADFGIVLAYDRLILGEIRTIELDSFFQPIWSVGGIYKVACEFVFDSGLNISRATVQIPMFLEPSDGILPPREQAAWSAIWRGVRGKRPEW